MQARIPISGGYNEYKERWTGTERTINMYGELNEANKLLWLKSNFGFDLVTSAPSGTGRDFYSESGLTFVTIRDVFYQFDGTNLSPLGTLLTLTGQVSYSHNNANQIILVDGSKGYIWNTLATTFTQIGAAGFPNLPEFVLFLDGYFIVNEGGTAKWHVSALNDGTSWDALNFAFIQSKPDTLIAGAVLHRRLYLFGTRSTEVWFNAGLTGFPFERDNNLLLEYGCAAPASVVQGYDMICWLAASENNTYSIKITTGGVPITISTHAIEEKFDDFDTVSDVYGNLYKEDGHIFYELTAPTENVTFRYDFSTQLWFEREMENGDRYKARSYGHLGNKLYFSSYDDSSVNIIDKNQYMHGTENIRRERISAAFQEKNDKKIRINKLMLDILPGVGNLTNEEDPEIWMFISKDGGFVYGNGIKATLGKIGERNAIARWHNLGTSGGIKGGNWVFKFIYSGETPFMMGDAIIDYDVLED